MLVSSIDFHAKCLPLLHRLDRVAKSEIRKRQLLSSSIVCQMKNSGLQMQQNQVRRLETVRVRLSHIAMFAVLSLSVATCLSSGNLAVTTFLILFLSVGACVSDIYAKTWSDQHNLQSAAYQYFLHNSMQIMGWFASSKLAKDSLCADKIQETLLMDLIVKQKDTELGKLLRLNRILSVKDFRSQINLTRSSFYEPYVQKIIKNVSNVMTSEPVTLLAATSGTSGQKSLIPHVPSVLYTFFVYGIAILFDRIFSKSFLNANHLQKTVKLIFAPRWKLTDGEYSPFFPEIFFHIFC